MEILTSLLFALAVIRCRAVIHLQPISVEAVELVGNFMAINLLVTKDRSKIYSTYGSEPILAEAAASLWNTRFKSENDNDETQSSMKP